MTFYRVLSWIGAAVLTRWGDCEKEIGCNLTDEEIYKVYISAKQPSLHG